METSECYSLSGYLSLKSFGALSLVLPARRYWCAFNESSQTLQFFQSERDLIGNKPPIESIPLHRAAITLSTSEERVFVILTDNKEYHLRAENHEALMIWLVGLQSKRDSCLSNKTLNPTTNEKETPVDMDELTSTCFNNEDSWRTIRSDSFTRHDFLLPTVSLTERPNLSDFSSEDEKCHRNFALDNIHRKMSLTSNGSAHLCNQCTLSLCTHCRHNFIRSSDSSQTTIKEPNSCRTGSSSNSIESSDSAFCEQRLLDNNDGLHNQIGLQETLLTLKCELASLVNKESAYVAIIKEKSEAMRKLEKQLSDVTTSSSKHQAISKVFNERSRETNNELKFLHCEVLKLHRIIRDDDIKMRKLVQSIRQQLSQREGLQRDYIYLLQTALSTEDGRLFGGSKHRDRLKDLLNECRKRDPSLPSFESLEGGSGVYIDSYGFKHEKTNEHDRLQYICVQLAHFYDSKTHTTDEHLWRTLLKSFNSCPIVSKTFKQLIRQGIPRHLRTEIWHAFIQKKVAHIRRARGPSYFQNLCLLLPNSDLCNKFEKQIALDLYRTMPTNIRFLSKDADGIRQMRQVLQVFCLHNPSVGYCQGMNFIVAVALLFLDIEDAFWLLVTITECHLNNYYDIGLIGAQVDQFVLKDLIQQKASDLYRHFEMIEVEITSLTLNWFMAIFIDSVPFETLLRIWDCFLLEGPKVLFRFALAILILNRETILTRTDTISTMKQIKDATKNLIDVESLFQIAFDGLKPFCHRKDLAIKQAYWTKMLAEKVIQRQLSRDGFVKRDYVEVNQSLTTLDCAVVLPGNLVWIAFGSQCELRLFEVNVERGIMIDLEITYNSRAFCMACVNTDLVLIGTLCGTLLGFSIDERKIKWATRLRSCLLCMTSLNKTDLSRVYCGLSDGNLAIVELHDQHEPEEAFCITIDKSAVTSVVFRQEKLWCLSSNKMTILNEKTLDILSCIDLGFESIDATSILFSDENDSHYIWILRRSTGNMLQIWNQFTCQLHAIVCLNHVFDRIGKTDEQLAAMEDTDSIVNDGMSSSSSAIDEHRITSILVHEQQLWVGTSTGTIYVFDFVFESKIVHRSRPNFLRQSNLTGMKTIVSHARSLSVTSHWIDETARCYAPENGTIDCRKKYRSRSESAMKLVEQELVSSSDDCWHVGYSSARHLYRIAFPIVTKTDTHSIRQSSAVHRRRKRHHSTLTCPTHHSRRMIENRNSWRKNREGDSGDTSTTLTSIRTRSSSPAIISTDEWRREHPELKSTNLAIKQQKSLESSAAAMVSFNLTFKAKIADAPVKCICKTRCNDQTVILTCSGKLGDDEVVCRWRLVQDTGQWTNDVIVELSPESMLPIRPHYARHQYLKDHRQRSVSISSTTSKL